MFIPKRTTHKIVTLANKTEHLFNDVHTMNHIHHARLDKIPLRQ